MNTETFNEAEMITVENYVESEDFILRTEKISSFAKKANTTVNTVYNWLKNGDMFVQDLTYPCKSIAVYRMVKFVETK